MWPWRRVRQGDASPSDLTIWGDFLAEGIIPQAPPASRAARKSWFYTAFTGAMLALGLIAFSDNLVTDIGQPSNSDPKMVVHGLFALAWMILLTVQANLVRTGRVALHRRIGPVVFLVGAGLVASTAFLFYTSFRGFDAMSPSVIANRIMLPVFAVAVFLAWRKRSIAQWHKRLLALGTALTLSPILFRVVGGIFAVAFQSMDEASSERLLLVVLITIWTAFMAAQWIYDWQTIRRIHAVTIAATLTLYGVLGFAYSI